MFGADLGVSAMVNALNAQMNAFAVPRDPVPVRVLTDDLMKQGERLVLKLVFCAALLPDWIEWVLLNRWADRLDGISSQLEHFSQISPTTEN